MTVRVVAGGPIRVSGCKTVSRVTAGGGVRVIAGGRGPTGLEGEPGPPGQNGKDGSAEIPDILDGGNF